MELEPIKNRVAQSPLVTIDIEELMDTSSVEEIDLKEALFQGMILREKDFRNFVKEKQWSEYQSKNVRIYCSADAIIPSWAYMLMISKLSPIANVIAVGNESDLEKALIDQALQKLDIDDLTGKKVVVKGCGSLRLREYYYSEITKRLTPVVSSIMYGEPCSTVPIFKRKSGQ